MDKIPLLPKKQSNWVHVPIGRILEPLNNSETNSLKNYCIATQSYRSYKMSINHFHLVHEKQWYQNQIDLIKTFNAL